MMGIHLYWQFLWILRYVLTFYVKINIIEFVNTAKSSTVDSTTLARIENKKVIIVVANTTPLLTFSIMYLIFFFIVFFYPKITAQKMDVEPAKWEKYLLEVFTMKSLNFWWPLSNFCRFEIGMQNLSKNDNFEKYLTKNVIIITNQTFFFIQQVT